MTNPTGQAIIGIPLNTRKTCHPFRCRLTRDAAFNAYNPSSLVGAGFASLSLAMFTAFRLTPVLFLTLLASIYCVDDEIQLFKKYSLMTIIFWQSIIFLVLVFFAVFLLCTPTLRKRFVLLLHPWGLLLLYFDVFIWTFLCAYLHIKVLANGDEKSPHFNNVYLPVVYFCFMYFDITIYFVAYYVFATYFIVAEITVIEFCY